MLALALWRVLTNFPILYDNKKSGKMPDHDYDAMMEEERMHMNENIIRAICDFFADSRIDVDWRVDHTEVNLDASTKKMTIVVNNMNEQEFGWIKEEVERDSGGKE